MGRWKEFVKDAKKQEKAEKKKAAVKLFNVKIIPAGGEVDGRLQQLRAGPGGPADYDSRHLQPSG